MSDTPNRGSLTSSSRPSSPVHEMSIINILLRSRKWPGWFLCLLLMRCFGTRCSRQRRNRDTYNDILSRLEGADVVGVMHVIHLLQDGRHAGEIVTLQQRRRHYSHEFTGKRCIYSSYSLYLCFAKRWKCV